jgi:transcriptional regulator with XRE-family HTH domain
MRDRRLSILMLHLARLIRPLPPGIDVSPRLGDTSSKQMDDRRFADNLERLLGLHAFPAKYAARALGLSQSAFSTWQSGRRQPSFDTAMRIGDFFEIEPRRLARASFASLLANELADAERFERVEQRIRQARRAHLHEVVQEENPEFAEIVMEDIVKPALRDDEAVRAEHDAAADPGSIHPETLDSGDLTAEEVLELAKEALDARHKERGSLE